MGVTESKKLSMTFASEAGKSATMTIENPVDDLTAETVSNAMASIIDTSVFTDSEGSPLNIAKTAKLTTTTTEDLF